MYRVTAGVEKDAVAICELLAQGSKDLVLSYFS